MNLWYDSQDFHQRVTFLFPTPCTQVCVKASLGISMSWAVTQLAFQAQQNPFMTTGAEGQWLDCFVPGSPPLAQ